MKCKHIVFTALLTLSVFLLSGCHMAILDPQGMIARSEMRLLIDAVLLMLVIVLPVEILILVIIWRYRANNKKAAYRPNWSHSREIEAICWSVPCIIVVVLAIMTWVSSHKLNPYKPIVIKGKPALTIQVVALNWKWLFIYPKQNIATVNYVQIPLDRPIKFEITADAPMNSLEIPQLAGQIYAMPGMRTKLYITADKAGTYDGLSTNYSGDGFAQMTFKIKAGSEKAFKQWVSTVKRAPNKLSTAVYKKLSKNSINNKVAYYSSVKKDLFQDVIIQFMVPPSDKIGEMKLRKMLSH